MALAENRGAIDFDTGAIGVFRDAACQKPKPSQAKLHTQAVAIKFDVVIEYCSRSAFHTRHKPGSYLGIFEEVKEEILRRHPSTNVISNPWETNRDFNRGRRQWVVLDHLAPMEDVSRPRLGSFEVAVVGPAIGVKLLHSKLETGRFPNPKRLAESVIYALDESWMAPETALPSVVAATPPCPGRGPRRRPNTLTPRVKRNLPIAQPRVERTWHLPHHPANNVRPVRDVRALSVMYAQRELRQRLRAGETLASCLSTPPEPFSPVNDWSACQAESARAFARTAELLGRLKTPAQIAAEIEKDPMPVYDAWQSASVHGSVMHHSAEWSQGTSFGEASQTRSVSVRLRSSEEPKTMTQFGEHGSEGADEEASEPQGEEDAFEADMAEFSVPPGSAESCQKSRVRRKSFLAMPAAHASPPSSDLSDDLDRTRVVQQPISRNSTLQVAMPVPNAASIASHGATSASKGEYSDFESSN